MNKKLAGSALLQYPDTVEAIIKAVVNAVDVPVTLKIRTGWNPENRNGVDIARIAEQNGIQSLAVHGRTRACMYKGKRNTTPFAKLRQQFQFRLLLMVTLFLQKKHKRCLITPGQMV